MEKPYTAHTSRLFHKVRRSLPEAKIANQTSGYLERMAEQIRESKECILAALHSINLGIHHNVWRMPQRLGDDFRSHLLNKIFELSMC
jgi:hypothetical protein